MLLYDLDDETDEDIEISIKHKDEDECNHRLCPYVRPSTRCTCNCKGRNHGKYYRADGPAT